MINLFKKRNPFASPFRGGGGSTAFKIVSASIDATGLVLTVNFSQVCSDSGIGFENYTISGGPPGQTVTGGGGVLTLSLGYELSTAALQGQTITLAVLETADIRTPKLVPMPAQSNIPVVNNSEVLGIAAPNLIDASGNGNGLFLGGNGYPSIVSNPWAIGSNACKLSVGMNAVGFGAAYDISSGDDYTWEFRFARNNGNLATTQVVFGRWADSDGGNNGNQYLCYFDSSDKLNYLEEGGGAVTTSAITDSNPHAVAIVRTSGSYYLYLDGTRVSGPQANSPVTVSADIPFQIGDYNDIASSPAGGLPFAGTLGDIRFSNIARQTGSSYTVSTSPLTSDAHTVALLPLDSLHGVYLGTPVYQGNALVRGTYLQALGGWANPDGIAFDPIANDWFFSASAFSSLTGTGTWTMWAVSAPDLATLLNGGGTLTSAVALQTPGTGEGDLAANGSLVVWNGGYFHIYADVNANIRVSTNTNKTTAFPQGTVLFAGFDPSVRPDPTGTFLEMYFARVPGGPCILYYSTSTDGTTWTTPVLVDTNSAIDGCLLQGGYQFNSGEPSRVEIDSISFISADGCAASSGVGRIVTRLVSPDRVNWLPCKQLYGASGAKDAGGNTYVAAFDSSPYYDKANSRVVWLSSNSTNTIFDQPTNSDIGVWFAPVVGA